MELWQVKNILLQTEIGGMLMDNMECSEPVLTQSNEGLTDNFFVYSIHRKNGVCSAPLARFGLLAEKRKITKIVFCRDEPFSVLPETELAFVPTELTKQDYDKYAALYADVRRFAFKSGCTDEEKRTLDGYLKALGAVTAEVLLPFCKELAPSFFDWAKNELN